MQKKIIVSILIILVAGIAGAFFLQKKAPDTEKTPIVNPIVTSVILNDSKNITFNIYGRNVTLVNG